MSTQIRAFRPLAPTQNLAVGTAPQTITLNFQLGTPQVRLCNIGTQTVFINVDGAAADVTTGVPLPAGQTEIFRLATNTASISAIAAAIGSTLYTTVGEGL